MTNSDRVALVFLVAIVAGIGWAKDKLFGYLVDRPTLRTRMYLQTRKERKKRKS